MSFLAPIAVVKAPADPRALWRRLFMEALAGQNDPSNDEISSALYAAALLSATPVIRVVDALVELGLRAPMEAFPKPWIATMRGRVLDLADRELLSYPLASLAASWGWVAPPVARMSLPLEVDPELDPYGADLALIFNDDIGLQPRFGYTPAQIRLGLLRTAVGLGRPLAEIVTSLVERGMTMPGEAVPAGCRESLKETATHPLVKELLRSWHEARIVQAEIIQLRRAQ